jgi:hypothetical protein
LLIIIVVLITSSLTDKDQEDFPIVIELFIQPSCSENCSHFLLSPNHEYVLEDISCLHILEEKNNNVDQLTQGEEINTQCIPFFQNNN